MTNPELRAIQRLQERPSKLLHRRIEPWHHCHRRNLYVFKSDPCTSWDGWLVSLTSSVWNFSCVGHERVREILDELKLFYFFMFLVVVHFWAKCLLNSLYVINWWFCHRSRNKCRWNEGLSFLIVLHGRDTVRARQSRKTCSEHERKRCSHCRKRQSYEAFTTYVIARLRIFDASFTLRT